MKDPNNDASIQFFRGQEVTYKPKIKVVRNKDGKTGKAIFLFNIDDEINEESLSKITQMIMEDKEGKLISKKINITLINKNTKSIKVIYSWREDNDFKRFMRFVQNYSKCSQSYILEPNKVVVE